MLLFGFGFELVGEVLVVGVGVGDLLLGFCVVSFFVYIFDYYLVYGDVVLMLCVVLVVYFEVFILVEVSVYYIGLLVVYFGLVDLVGLKVG